MDDGDARLDGPWWEDAILARNAGRRARWLVGVRGKRPLMRAPGAPSTTPSVERIRKTRLDNDGTYLQTGALRMTLLLLGTFDAGSLTAGALAARGLALSAGHC
jgi:hypothetical protein